MIPTPRTDAIRDAYRGGDIEAFCRALISHANELERETVELGKDKARLDILFGERLDDLSIQITEGATGCTKFSSREELDEYLAKPLFHVIFTPKGWEEVGRSGYSIFCGPEEDARKMLRDDPRKRLVPASEWKGGAS